MDHAGAAFESAVHAAVGTSDAAGGSAVGAMTSGSGVGGATAGGGSAAGGGGGESIAFPDRTWTLLTKPTAAFGSSDGVDDHVGVFVDSHHFQGLSSWAGLRFIAEDPAHLLNMIGSDDGTSFWSLGGFCTGAHMTSIHFDFSPKGGPAKLIGTWAAAPARTRARGCIGDLAGALRRRVQSPSAPRGSG